MRQLQRSGKLVRNVRTLKIFEKLKKTRARSRTGSRPVENSTQSAREQEGTKEMSARWAGLRVLLLAGIANARETETKSVREGERALARWILRRFHKMIDSSIEQ